MRERVVAKSSSSRRLRTVWGPNFRWAYLSRGAGSAEGVEVERWLHGSLCGAVSSRQFAVVCLIPEKK